MERQYRYAGLRFSGSVLQEAYATAAAASINRTENKESHRGGFRSTFVVHSPDDSENNYDTLDEFLVAYNNSPGDARIGIHGINYTLSVWCYSEGTRVTVMATKAFVRSIFDIFDRNKATATKVNSIFAEPESSSASNKPVIFVGHGRKNDWRDLRDHLRDMQKFEVLTYESDPHAGYSNPDVVEAYVKRSNFGLLVFTGEDRQTDGNLRARQNVVHELGLLTNKVGRKRAIVLLEEGTESLSNISGVQVIPFRPGHIELTFGHVMAVIRREFA